MKPFALGGLAFIFWCFLVWVQLPGDRLGQTLAHQINQNLTPPYRLQIQGAEPGWMGLGLEGVQLWDQGSKELLVELGQLDLSFAPWYLFRGRVGFETIAYGGEIAGSLGFLFGLDLDLEASHLQPNRIMRLRKTGLIHSNPELELKVQLNLDNMQARGMIDIQLHNLIIEAKAKDLNLMMDVPPTNFLKLDARLEIEPKSTFIQLAGKGDLSTNLSGKVEYSDLGNLQRARMDLSLKLKPKEEYLESLGVIAQFAKSFTDPTGVIGLRLHGNLLAPQIEKL